jgi:Inner membrane component of T3SS, cytoplasmic domain/zinc-ribbon domain
VAEDVFCSQCGHRNPATANFCSSCGAPLSRQREDSTTVTFFPDAAENFDELAVDYDEGVPSGTGILVVKRGPNVGSRFALEKDVVRAGRHPDSDIFLDDVTVSRRHVDIVRGEGGYVVKDVGSLNGTYLNRERVESAPLSDGDELQIGTFKLVFLTGREDAT